MPRQVGYVLAIVVLSVGSVQGAASPLEQLPIQAAIGRAKQSGLPMLVVATTEHCPYCVKLRTLLTTDPELQQLTPQYVAQEIRVGTPDWDYWTRLFKPHGDGVPLIYIVTSTGKELYNQAGLPAGDGLKKLLLQGIAQTGGPKKLGPQRDAMLLAVKKVENLLAHHKKAEAVAMAAKHAAAAASADKLGGLIQEWSQEAAGQLKQARADLAASDRAVTGIVAAMAVQRTYGSLPEVKDALKQFVADVQKLPQGSELLDQARALDKARSFEEHDSKRAAAATYQGVVAQYPHTPAARIAQQHLDDLTAKIGPVAQLAKAEGHAAGGTAAGNEPADDRKLNAYLKMARTIADRNPDKAREYLQKILDQAPASTAAAEARDMLKGL